MARDFDQQIIDEFRMNGGRVGGRFANTPLLLLTVAGAKTGEPRTLPLAYLADGDRYVVFASKAGAPEHPWWYHNLIANPAVTVEVGAERFTASATMAEGGERDELYARQAARFPAFKDYQEKTSRLIPVVVLERA